MLTLRIFNLLLFSQRDSSAVGFKIVKFLCWKNCYVAKEKKLEKYKGLMLTGVENKGVTYTISGKIWILRKYKKLAGLC